jgi:hypothetical protein
MTLEKGSLNTLEMSIPSDADANQTADNERIIFRAEETIP